MHSPAKKIDFVSAAADKENYNSDEVAVPIVGIPDIEVPEVKADAKPNVAATIKAEEAHEPLLQENPQRFVLFPIRYHEVCRRRALLTRRVPRQNTLGRG